LAHHHGWYNSHSGRSLERELLMPAVENFRRCCTEHLGARQLPLEQKTPTGKRLSSKSTFQHRELPPKHFTFPALELTWPGKKTAARAVALPKPPPPPSAQGAARDAAGHAHPVAPDEKKREVSAKPQGS
jgi:hypothetical protein